MVASSISGSLTCLCSISVLFSRPDQGFIALSFDRCESGFLYHSGCRRILSELLLVRPYVYIWESDHEAT